jgi:hypothetical protein
MKVCFPEEIWLLRVNTASIPLQGPWIVCYTEITHTTTKHFFKTNLTFYSICVVVCVDGYIAVIRKRRIETKHSTTWEIVFCVHLYGVVCFYQVIISFVDEFANTRQQDTWYLFPRSIRSRETWSFVLKMWRFLANHRHSYIYEVY